MDIFKKGIKLFFTTVIVCVICFFVVVSFNALKVGLFSKDIGYNVYGVKGGEVQDKPLYTYYLKDVKDPDSDKYKKDGYKLSEKPITAEIGEGEKAKTVTIGYEVYGKKDKDAEEKLLYKYYNEEGEKLLSKEYKAKKVELHKYSIRSEVENKPDIACSILSQIFCIVILASFVYNDLWKAGNKDFEAIRLHKLKLNKLKGLYIGLIAIFPSLLLLVFCLATKSTTMAKMPIAIFTISNSYAWEIITAVTNGAMYWKDVNVLQAVVYFAMLSFIPVISLVSYIIGVKDISLSEKFVYKNNKKLRRG